MDHIKHLIFAQDTNCWEEKKRYFPIFHPPKCEINFFQVQKIQAEKFNLHKLLVMREQCKWRAHCAIVQVVYASNCLVGGYIWTQFIYCKIHQTFLFKYYTPSRNFILGHQATNLVLKLWFWKTEYDSAPWVLRGLVEIRCFYGIYLSS